MTGRQDSIRRTSCERRPGQLQLRSSPGSEWRRRTDGVTKTIPEGARPLRRQAPDPLHQRRPPTGHAFPSQGIFERFRSSDPGLDRSAR
jgi:hypothetical protein